MTDRFGATEAPVDVERAQSPTESELQAAPTFYSAVSRAVESAKQAKASPDQWLATIRNTPGVKPEELQWLGLEDWLKEQKGPVTRDEIADYVRANKIEVHEVQKFDKAAIANMSIDEIKEYNRTHTSPPNTKYESYVLPGGENYRELLLTLPSANDKYMAFTDAMRAKYGDKPLGQMPMTADEQAYIDKQINSYGDGNKDVYKSPHFDESNVLAHVRMNDRTIDGKRTLFVEEVQSDWHQKGKREGYQGRGKSVDDVDREINSIRDEAERIEPRLTYDDATVGDWQAFWDAHPEMKQRWDALYFERGHVQYAVPDAPFKTTWPELAMKRILRYAAENGYEKVAWTSGDTQAERYDLSKHYDQIMATKRRDGTYNIGGTQVGDPAQSAIADHVPEEKLAEYVGKDLADKIVKEGGGEYSGVDLKVGGEGMKGFYDKILPTTVNKLVKKFGGKVGEGEIDTGKGQIPGGAQFGFQRADDGTWFVRRFDNAERIATGLTREQAQAEMVRLNGGNLKETMRVHTLDITDQLRDAATEQGFPLFRRPSASEQVREGAQDGEREVRIGATTVASVKPSDKYTENETKIAKAVQEIGQRLAPQAQIRGATAIRMGGDPIWGAFINSKAFPHLIAWSLERPIEGNATRLGVISDTVRHEVIHHLKEAGLIRPDEWSALSKAAKDGDWIKKYDIDERYPKDSPELKIEEAIAEHFAQWRTERAVINEFKGPARRLVQGAYNRLDLFFKRVAATARQFLGRNATANDVFTGIETGEVGARPPRRAHGGRVEPRNINHHPTEAQKAKGNYAKDHVHIHGLPLTIENAKGSFRSGIGKDGKPWKCCLPAHYGYIKQSEGADGDHVDVYLGPHQKSPHVYVIDQVDAETKKFDETKVFLGFCSERQALRAYEQAFSDGKGKERVGRVIPMTVSQFRDWLKGGDTKKPFAAHDERKLTHGAVGYVAASKKPKQNCGLCSMFIAERTGGPGCTLVKSPINEGGWCRRFNQS